MDTMDTALLYFGLMSIVFVLVWKLSGIVDELKKIRKILTKEQSES